jgi:uncharacterized caspase-like protein
MIRFARAFLLCLTAIAAAALAQGASAAETRFALVIGNDEYKDAKLTTPANDAGLVADALTAAGFTVTGARNLDQSTLRESFREFLGQVSAAGPDAVALVYLAGFGLQFDGDNFFVPVDADIQKDTDVPLQAIRIADFTQPLAALPGRVKIIILDAARANQFASNGGQPLAGGLALVDPVPGLAMAFNAAPGTVGPDEPGPYGAYATALTEMIAAGGLGLDDLFARVRLRVSDLTKGVEIPWYASHIDGPFFMTERNADAPPPPNVMPLADVRTKSMRDFGSVEDAYEAALERDSLEGYDQFLAIYPSSPYSKRIAAMLAVRREEVIWRRAIMDDSPQAYWSYLRRYPNGPHVWDARRRLAILRAAYEPPPDFAYVDFGVPPPPPGEIVIVERPIIVFEGPEYAPPPPPPLFFLPPRPREFVVLPPPPPQRERFALPVPTTTPVRTFVRPPTTVAVRPPPGPAGGGATGNAGFSTVALPNAVQHGPGAQPVPIAHPPGPVIPGQPGQVQGNTPGRTGTGTATGTPPNQQLPHPPALGAGTATGTPANQGTMQHQPLTGTGTATGTPGNQKLPQHGAPPTTPTSPTVPTTPTGRPNTPSGSPSPQLGNAPTGARTTTPAVTSSPPPTTANHPATGPALAKPVTPPPPPPPQPHPTPSMSVAKPPPPPSPPPPSPPPSAAPHAAGPAATNARPACPPGKTMTPQGCR